jgi:ubiquinone biosynthesis protein COQ9
MNEPLDATEAAETIAESAAALEKSRDRLLLATLPHVAFEGWSGAALRAGCTDAGLADEQGKLIFPEGAREIIVHWSAWSDRQMLETIQLRPDFAALRMRERIAAAVRARIDVNGPWRETVRRTIALLALPPNVGIGLSCTWRTLDAIWYACGDSASDFSFYSKRATLAGVYGATVLYWLDDSSDESIDTWAFLDRRIDDVMRLPKLRSQLRHTLSRMLPSLPHGGRSAAEH